MAVTLGELEISSFTVGFLILLTVFTFTAVGLSSLRLFESATEDKDE